MVDEQKTESLIPAAHYAALGRVSDTWADLEFAIDHAIWALLNIPQALGACVTSQMVSIHPRNKALMSLLNLFDIDDHLTKDLSSVLGRAAGLSEIRNRLIHDKRLVRARAGEVVRFEVNAKNNLIFTDQSESVKDLGEFTTKIESIILAFDKVWTKIDSALHTSGGKLRGKLPQLARLPRGQGSIQLGDSKIPQPPPEPSHE